MMSRVHRQDYEMARVESVIGSQLLLEALPDLRLRSGFEPHLRIVGATYSPAELPIEF